MTIDIKFKLGKATREFGLKTFKDDSQGRLIYFVQMDNGAVLVFERRRDGKFYQLTENLSDFELQESILREVKNVLFETAFAKANPVSQLEDHWLTDRNGLTQS
jgi:hypothetical protein